MNIFAVTVTYGNRFHLLKQVIDAVLREGVAKVIVVDNNSVPESREQLREYEQKLGSDKIKVLYLDDNYGSAGGFKRGLEEAYNDPECEFIWILDDDNVPEKNALKKLILAFDYLGTDDSNILVSCRKNLIGDNFVIKNGIIVGYRFNNFAGFHFKDLLFRKIFGINFYQKGLKFIDPNDDNYKIMRIQIAPYGGLFFSKDVIGTVGYPDKNFFVYADDHEWTYRMNANGYKIYICSESKINDLEVTQQDSGVFKTKKLNFLKDFYGIRNHIYFSKKFISNKFLFSVNMLVFIVYKLCVICVLFIKDPFIASKKFKILSKAFYDGLNNKISK